MRDFINLLLIVLLFGHGPFQRSMFAEREAFTVCSLTREPNKYKEKVVTVRGDLDSSGLLTGKNCNRTVLPSQMYLAHPDSETEIRDQNLSQIDGRSILMLWNSLATLGDFRRNVRVQLTASGYFRVAPGYGTEGGRMGHKSRGFGHMGLFAAEFVVFAVHEVTITVLTTSPSEGVPPTRLQ